MKKELQELIEFTIENLNWSFIESYLNSEYYAQSIPAGDNHPVNIKLLKANLADTINFIIANDIMEMITTTNWSITWTNPETMSAKDKKYVLKISFIPTEAAGYLEFHRTQPQKINETNDLEKHLKKALLEEDYERAALLKKMIDDC